MEFCDCDAWIPRSADLGRGLCHETKRPPRRGLTLLPPRHDSAVGAASAGDGTIAFRKSNPEDPRDTGHRYGDLCEVEAVRPRGCWGLASWTCNPRGATAARPDASTPYDKNDRTGRRPARTSTAQLGEDYRCAGRVEGTGRGRWPSSPGEWTGTASAGLDRDRKDRASPHRGRPGGLDPEDTQAQPAPGRGR